MQLKQFNGTIIKTLGIFEGMFETKNHFEILPITVVACTKGYGLLGIEVLKVDSSKSVNSIELKEQEIGLLKSYKASICLKENYHLRYIQARQLPIHILPIVVSKLKKMIQQGILEKVTHGGSDWASSIVAIKKTDENIRICGDYKIIINHQISLDSFPLPSIKTVGHELANMKHFAKINLKSAYNQIEIDNKFKEIITLRSSCLPFGIKTASHIFQRAIEKILLGKVDNIIMYQDDICLVEELKSKTEQVLQRLKQAGMTIDGDKCKLDYEKISYLGYQISREGISPEEMLTNKIAKMQKPMNKKELESFFGLINFYSRYLPRHSEFI